MRKLVPVFIGLVLITTLASGLRSEPRPSVWLSASSMNSDQSRSPSDLVVKIKKKKKKHHDEDDDEGKNTT